MKCDLTELTSHSNALYLHALNVCTLFYSNRSSLWWDQVTVFIKTTLFMFWVMCRRCLCACVKEESCWRELLNATYTNRLLSKVYWKWIETHLVLQKHLLPTMVKTIYKWHFLKCNHGKTTTIHGVRLSGKHRLLLRP